MSRPTAYIPPRARRRADDTSSVGSRDSTWSSWSGRKSARQSSRFSQLQRFAQQVRETVPKAAPPKVEAPPPPPVPLEKRNDLAARLTKLYKPAEPEKVEVAEEEKKEEPKVYIIPKRTQPSMRERLFSSGYLRLPRGLSVTMVAFPSLEAAKEILYNLEESEYILGLLAFSIPVVLTKYSSIADYDYEHQTSVWGDRKEKKGSCLIVDVDHEYTIPVMAEDSWESWKERFQHAFADPEGMAGLLDLDFPATEWLKNGKTTLYEEPSEREWEAFRLIHYVANQTDPRHPIFYPHTLYKVCPDLDLSFLTDKAPYVHPWSGPALEINLTAR